MAIKDSALEALCAKIVAEIDTDYIKDCKAQGIKPLSWEERISEATDELIKSMQETPLIEQAVANTLLGLG